MSTIMREKLFRVLQESLDALDSETRERIADNPGTSARIVGDTIEFSAAGIVYAVVDREWITSDDLDFCDVSAAMVPRAESLPDTIEGMFGPDPTDTD